MFKPKISIIGAGNVGIRFAYGLMIHGIARSLVIIDLDKKRAEGETLDLASGMPYLSPIDISVGGYPDISDSDLIVITAGKKQKAGQSRLDLVKDNVSIFKEIIPKLMRYAPEAIYLIVSNPLDVLAYATYKISSKPWHEIIGSGTVLDTARLRFLISEHCNIDARNIHAYILGEHGDSEFPVWSSATFGGTLLNKYCSRCHKCNNQKELNNIFKQARDYAYEIIEKKQETSYGIGLALVRISEAIIKNENSVLPVSCFVQDYYGIKDVYMSLPAVINRKGVREILDLDFNEQEKSLFKKSADAIKSVIKQAGL